MVIIVIISTIIAKNRDKCDIKLTSPFKFKTGRNYIPTINLSNLNTRILLLLIYCLPEHMYIQYEHRFNQFIAQKIWNTKSGTKGNFSHSNQGFFSELSWSSSPAHCGYRSIIKRGRREGGSYLTTHHGTTTHLIL